MWNMYSLTDLTGKRASSKRITGLGVSVPSQRKWAAVIAVGAASLAIFIQILGAPGFLVALVVTAVAALALFKGTSRNDTRLWVVSRRDKAREGGHQFFIGGYPVDPLDTRVFTLTQNSISVEELERLSPSQPLSTTDPSTRENTP